VNRKIKCPKCGIHLATVNEEKFHIKYIFKNLSRANSCLPPEGYYTASVTCDKCGATVKGITLPFTMKDSIEADNE
jgi:predicted nucleic-acid-binding Zn-ribbon protein